MFDIANNGIIRINRGDSFSLDVFINVGTCIEPIQYILQPGDSVYFALMEPNQPFEHALMRREFTNVDLDEDDRVIMNFSSDQTEYLMPGTYYYMIKLRRLESLGESGEENTYAVDTIIPKTKFIIAE